MQNLLSLQKHNEVEEVENYDDDNGEEKEKVQAEKGRVDHLWACCTRGPALRCSEDWASCKHRPAESLQSTNHNDTAPISNGPSHEY